MAAMKIWYDREGDYLEITFKDSPASLVELEDDIFQRRTTDGRVIGLAVFNFSQHDKDSLQIPLTVSVDQASA